MHKLLDAEMDYAVVHVAANEDFSDAQALESASAGRARAYITGWDAYEVWHSRIRLLPGATSLFLPRR
jgi:hypothetical protein